MYKTICNDQEHEFHTHPMDYTLFHLGSFDFENGAVIGFKEPHNLGMAAQMIEQRPAPVIEQRAPREQLDIEDQIGAKA